MLVWFHFILLKISNSDGYDSADSSKNWWSEVLFEEGSWDDARLLNIPPKPGFAGWATAVVCLC